MTTETPPAAIAPAVTSILRTPQGDETTRPANKASLPRVRASAGSTTSPQASVDSAPKRVTPAGSQTTAAAKGSAMPDMGPPVPCDPGQQAADLVAPPKAHPPLADPFLALAADVLDDLEKVRIANENRLRQLTRDEADADGEERGFGLDESHPDVARLAALVATLGQAEHQAALNLQRMMRRHPLGPWAKAQRGVGDKQAARLLAAIGDPYWNTLHDRPRTVSELWAYCGYHVIRTSVSGQPACGTQTRDAADGADIPTDQCPRSAQDDVVGGDQAGHPDQRTYEAPFAGVGVAPKRARGQRANWSSTAKMRAFLIAESTLKQLSKTCLVDPDTKAAAHADGCACSSFRKVYDAFRLKYADAVHQTQCVRCGPAGKPAVVGSPLSDGHKHARALRAVAKELLKELWRESKRLHEAAAPELQVQEPHTVP